MNKYLILILLTSLIIGTGCSSTVSKNTGSSYPGGPGVFVDTNNIPIEVPPSKLSE